MQKTFLGIICFLAIISISFAQEETRLLSFPNTSATEITFSYAGDIYTVPITGGLARRITSGKGVELFPRFSTDGKWIAFSGNYDGNQEVYIIPSTGGEPKRLTYSPDIGPLPERMGPDKIIMQWSWDNQAIYFRGRSDSWNSLVGKGYIVKTDGSLPNEFPLPKMGFFSMPPSGDAVAFNRIFREFRTWKRYSGGQADDIWIYYPQTKQTINITNNPAQDIIPMWIGKNIYFLSDRDRTMNLFVYNLDTKETRKLTNFTEFDVKFPSISAWNIAFTNGGSIYIMDLKTEQIKKVDIQIAEDFPDVRTEITKVSDNIENSEISPDGKFGLFSARGDIFIVPAEKGNLFNITKSNGVHDRNPKWSPDGKWIAFISDKTGEDEIYLIKPDGSSLTQLTNDAKSYRWELEWSPDSKYLLNSDKLMNVYLIDVATKVSKTIAHSKAWEIRDFSFSPDSKWVTYSDANKNDMSQVFLYSVADGKTYNVTSEFFDSAQPVWDPKGKYLYFVSGRDFHGKTGNFEYNYLFEDMQNLYGVTLSSLTQNPFKVYESDLKVEQESTPMVEEPKKKSKKKDEAEDNSLKIDLNGLQDRIFEIPTSRGNYFNVYAFENKLYYSRTFASAGPKMFVFDFETKKEEEVGDLGNYKISFDGKKIMGTKGRDFYITKLDKKIDLKDGKLDFAKMEINLDRKAEWKQIFDEAWRQMKYFFYDPNMHGVDWLAIKNRYEPLVKYVNHRTDLTYLIGEMIGELDVGHAYVGGGDMPKVDEVKLGLLGARYQFDAASKLYKITKIFEGRNWDESTRSPLTEPGIDVKVGDYLIAIDDNPLSETVVPNALLNNKANMYVKLTYNSKPTKDGSKEVWVKTIGNEAKLIYFNWVENNRRYVEKATNGRIGYIHIPDMGFDNGLLEFVKYFYPQLDKEGLIIDDRYNGGGNVSSMIAERLRREVAVARNARNQTYIGSTPGAVMPGPYVCLVNQQSMSDGDLFPYQFRKYNLGKIIGKRTWGGVIGIRGSLPFTDGSNMTKPEFANFGPNGEWILEDVGIYPDIEIENDPAKEYAGIDEQLDKAIQVILEEVKTNTKQQLPKTTPPYPKK